jgi:hypothetical protein
MEAHRKLQGFLSHIHDDLQRAELTVFFDCTEVDRDMTRVLKESIAQGGIILPICKPFLKQTVKAKPQGNIAREVNCTSERATTQPQAVLPLLLEGD